MSTRHPRRTAAAIVGIIACALTAIVVTAVIVIPRSGGEPGRTVAATPTTPPKLKPMVLTPKEVSELVGKNVTVTTDRDSLGQPAGPDFAVDPAACTSVGFYAQAVTYRNVSWRLARAAQYSAFPIIVSQSVVLTASPDVANAFLKEQGDAWERCLGETYRFGTFSAVTWRVDSVDTAAGPDRIFAITRQVGSPPESDCGHVMAVEDAYVIEAVTCGSPRFDTDELADMILARIPG